MTDTFQKRNNGSYSILVFTASSLIKKEIRNNKSKKPFHGSRVLFKRQNKKMEREPGASEPRRATGHLFQDQRGPSGGTKSGFKVSEKK